MRKAPQFLTYFFIVIAVQRVADYIANALHVAFMGWPFALGIAFGIYVGMYYQGTERARSAGRWAAWMFIIVDLIFNESELIRQLSATELIPPSSNFLGISQHGLELGMQVTAIIFGALPTLAVGFLGNLQQRADEHWRDKPSAIGRIGLAFQKMIGKFTIAFALRAEAFATNILPDAEREAKKLPVVDGQLTGKKWKDLTADDIAFIAANSRPAIMARFGISDGSAGNWRSAVAKGDRPWVTAENARKLTGGK